MFRPEAVLRAGVAIFALIAAGLAALLITAHIETVDPSKLPAVRPPKASAPTPVPSPLTDLGRADLGGVVTIQVEVQLSNAESLGTGWIFDSRGDIVTNAHVISGHVAIRVTDRDDRTAVAVVLGTDATADIALLRPEGVLPAQELPVDATALVKVPASVIALASSTATGHGDMTPETVIALHEDVPLAPNGGVNQGQVGPQVYNDMLHLEGEHIYEGNSGGPVLDATGHVVGILTLASPGSPDAYAIPISRVLAELTRWSQSG